jgi:ATP-binding cassette subfamily F protein 3
MAPIPAVVEDPTIVFRFPKPDQQRPPLMRLDQVAFGYRDGKNLFEKLDFSLDMESRVALVFFL